ncbi:MAG: LamG-like jellyroll fold domain-containing protein [Candidatus Paceibacterota bacterium]
MNKIIKKQLAFTLIELLVVIAIIGILSALIVVGMSSTTQKATIAKAQSFSHSIDNSLLLSRVSEWKLDEPSGTSANDFWNGKTATLVNAPTYTTGCPQGSCYTFNGSTQYAWIADDDNYFNFGTQMSAFVWVRGTTQASFNGIFSQYDRTADFKAWAIGVYSSPFNQIQVVLSDDGTANTNHWKNWISTSAILDGNWHHIGFTWNNGTFIMYVDGQSASTSSAGALTSNSIYNSNANLAIGCYFGGGSPEALRYFTGSIDDVRIYNQAIPTSQIQQNYFAELNKLFAKNQITQLDYQQRLAELSNNYAEN